jgi:hypothetical protein
VFYPYFEAFMSDALTILWIVIIVNFIGCAGAALFHGIHPKTIKPAPRRRFDEQVIHTNRTMGSRCQGLRKEEAVENSIDYDNYGGTD